MLFRSAIGALAPSERVAAWEAISAAVARSGSMASPKAGGAWLKKAIAEDDARLAATTAEVAQ